MQSPAHKTNSDPSIWWPRSVVFYYGFQEQVLLLCATDWLLMYSFYWCVAISYIYMGSGLTKKQNKKNNRDQAARAMWKLRWPSWLPVPNKPTVSVDIKQHTHLKKPEGGVVGGQINFLLVPGANCSTPSVFTAMFMLSMCIMTTFWKRKKHYASNRRYP